MEDAYALIAPFYDLEFDEFDADVELYLGYADYVGSPVLELGCGTGRLLLPLAKAGLQVHGIDSSPAMIARARARLEEAGISGVELRIGDMTDLSAYPAAHFRMVFAAINSFLHLETRERQLTALAEVHRVLHPDGILILDLFHPTPALLHAMEDGLRVDGQWPLPGGGRVDRFSTRRVYPAEQRIETTLYYDHTEPGGAVRRTVTSYTMRYIHRFEMEGLLDQAGFDLEGIYGSYELDPFDDDSAIMLFVAHRRP